MPTLAETFQRTLQQIEQSGDPAPLVDLFTDDAELLNLALTEPLRGREGAQRFWSNCLSVFGKIASKFHHNVETDGGAAFEWVSEGTLADGQPVNYRGISVIEKDGEKVSRFRTYYDSAVFLPGGAKHKEKEIPGN